MACRKVYIPFALKLHAFGLQRLHNPNWTGTSLYYHIRDHQKGRAAPHDLLEKTHREGLLYQLGGWLYQEYMDSEDSAYFGDLANEYAVWHTEDLLSMLDCHGVSRSDRTLARARKVLSKIGDLYDRDEDAYYVLLDSYRHRRHLTEVRAAMLTSHSELIDEVRSVYAENYANRVFHDRQLCGFISKLLLQIGFNGSDDGPAKMWVKRIGFPAWAVKAVIARDRGKCAECPADIVMEMKAVANVDHIVPLIAGGCNDLVNLQLLCRQCNQEKGGRRRRVRSSVPKYISRKRRKRTDK